MIVVPTEAFPLKWPDSVPRTRSRIDSKFAHNTKDGNGWNHRTERTTHEGVEDIRRELKMVGAKTIVISSNLSLRNDGYPRSDGSQQPNGDPGVAVYWTRYSKKNRLLPYAIPCDRYKRIADNLRAIALSIEAMRGMERWGAVSVEQAFAGFTVLPAGDGSESIPQQPIVDWRAILGGSWPDGLEPAEILGIAKARHRKLIAIAHPDAGGTAEAAAELNAAIEAAEQELRA